MNKSELINMITYSIQNAFTNEFPGYSLTTIKNCYYGSHEDIKSIGNEILINLNIDPNNVNHDKMISQYYFVFEYNNLYVIINFSCDIWNIAQFNVIIVKNRREALINRYGD